MDLSKMSIAELQSNALGHSGDIGVHQAIVELARRLEAEINLNNVYRTEIDACRNERGAFFSRTMNYEEWRAASKQAEIAMAATDAAMEVRSE